MKPSAGVVALLALVGIAGAAAIGWSASGWFGTAQGSSISGKWRPGYTANCSEKTYLVIEDHQMQLLRNGVLIPTVNFAIDISGSEARPLIKIKFPDGAPDVTMELQAVVADGAMRFESAQWSPEAVQNYGRDYLESRSPSQNTLSSFRSVEPLHRCP